MRIAATILIALVAALHLYFLVLEMFLWRTPFGRRTFGTTAEAAESSAVLAANQGLYNGFLAAGLIWALLAYGLIGGRPIITKRGAPTRVETTRSGPPLAARRIAGG